MLRTLARRHASAAALAAMCAAGGCSTAPGPAATDGARCEAGGAARPAGVLPLEQFRAVPNLTFDGLDASGAPAAIALHDFHLPCAAEARLLVVRVSAAWCGTCRVHAEHTRELLALDVGSRLELLDLLVANDDNMPPSREDLAAYRARIDAPRIVAADSAYQFRTVNPQRAALPLVVLIDRRTMRIEGFENDPSPEALAFRVRTVVAQLDGAEKPAAPAPELHDGRFTRNQWDMIRAIGAGGAGAAPSGPVGAPPPDPTNAKADDAAAAALGKELFADATLSPTGKVSCATCHDRSKGFSDGLPQSEGVAVADRNAPSVALASHARWQFWDGRADSLWMQALGPFENEREFGGSRLHVVHRVFDTPKYRAAYEAVFGPMPALGNAARFPLAGKPGDPPYDAMTPDDREAATRAFVNVGKAIGAFERTLRVLPNALDRYAAGDLTALSDGEKDGLRSFFTAGCAQCHFGPRMTDDAFHAIAFPTGRADRAADRGRAEGGSALLASEFNAASRFSDAPRSHPGIDAIARTSTMLGAFKTPPLRGVTASAPYGHGGTFATLEDVMKHYGQAGTDASPASFAGEIEPWLLKFDTKDRQAITVFLQVLTAEPAP